MNPNQTHHHVEWSPRARHDCGSVSDSWRLSPSPDFPRISRKNTPLPYGLAYDYSRESPSIRSPDCYGSLHSFTTSLPDLHHYFNSTKPLPRPDEFLFACRSNSPLDVYLGDIMEQSPQSAFEELDSSPSPLTEHCQDLLQPPSPESPQSTVVQVLAPRAHQVPPGCHSRYSELTPNLDFLKKLQQEALPKVPETCPVAPNTPPFRALAPRPRHILPSTARTLRRPDPLSLGLSGQMTSPVVSPTRSQFEKNLDSITNPPASLVARQRNTKEPRKPSLACIFCRERKIACGRPPSDSEDQTCNQCLRRSFKCEYKNEPSRRSSGSPSRK